MGAWAQADDGRLHQARQAWDDAIGAVDEARARQMAAPGLQEPAKKALATLDREWDGLIAHREFPMIGLDNNPAERAIRRPVVTRRNAYGSRNDDAARLAARIWTVTATAEMAGLNVTPASVVQRWRERDSLADHVKRFAQVRGRCGRQRPILGRTW
jgi:transposase